MTIPKASLAVLKPRSPSARGGATSRAKKIAALEGALARGTSPELASLAKRELVIEKGRERKRHLLRKAYADPAWTDPKHSEPRRRASLSGLLKAEPRKEIDTMTTPPKTANLTKILRARADAVEDAANKPESTDDARTLIKKAHAKGGTSLHLPERLRKVKK